MILTEAIERYLADRRARGIGARTVSNDRVTLGQLLAAVGPIQTHYLGPQQLDRLWAAHPNWSAGTFNLKRQQLMSFFDWLRRRGYIPKDLNPMDGVKKRRVPKAARTLIPQTEFETVLDAAPNPRDRAIVAIGLYLFTRVSETSQLRWRDIDFDGHGIHIYRTKTQEYDVLPMCEELEEELRKWKFTYAALAGEVVRPDWFVVPAYTKPRWKGMTGGGLVLMEEPRLVPTQKLKNLTNPIKGVLAKLGLDQEKEGGHTLRRSGATALYHELSRIGHDRAMRTAQAMLGHANISTTEIYLDLDLDRKARNDLLGGQRMFAAPGAGEVIELEARQSGQADG